MRCFSEWRTIPDKQRKISLARLGFEPATFGLLVRCSTNWATGQVGSWSSNDGICLFFFDISKQILVSSYLDNSLHTIRFKWLLWDSELGWRIIMRCFSEWRTIPDKQRKISLARLGFEPATFGLLVQPSTGPSPTLNRPSVYYLNDY